MKPDFFQPCDKAATGRRACKERPPPRPLGKFYQYRMAYLLLLRGGAGEEQYFPGARH
ncbi:hypothetical protein KL86DES1_20039 [uncultured Desulfovibrio sp.]|uniref:Uncharacterized protein n=1 Tax=uncultured Desulfovibrio sp. TaxID=167968 RepID=A0A212L1W5_9BACT|nr:hypothetical protein KL86DES1_20039 [uncultured Desulfovibrio sp.]VZH32940.1 conserved protein of unknown function [Desulfovibrio sp. 86]